MYLVLSSKNAVRKGGSELGIEKKKGVFLFVKHLSVVNIQLVSCGHCVTLCACLTVFVSVCAETILLNKCRPRLGVFCVSRR